MNYFSASRPGVESCSELERRFSLNDGSMVFIPLLFYAFFCQSLAASALVLDVCLLLSATALLLHFVTNRRFALRDLALSWLGRLSLCCSLFIVSYTVWLI